MKLIKKHNVGDNANKDAQYDVEIIGNAQAS